MSTGSSAHSPFCNARPARLTPTGPGNISGKIVSTVAHHGMLATRALHPLPLRERVVRAEGSERVRGLSRFRPRTRLADFVRSPPSPTSKSDVSDLDPPSMGELGNTRVRWGEG